MDHTDPGAAPPVSDAMVRTGVAALLIARRSARPMSDADYVRTVLEAVEHHRRPSRAERVLVAAEDLLAAVTPWPSRVFNGLALRRRPGAAQVATETYRETLTEIHKLRQVVEGSRPLYLTTGDVEWGPEP